MMDMSANTPRIEPVRLADYRPTLYAIRTVALDFRLDPEATEVTADLRLERRDGTAPGTPLEFAYELSWQGDAQQRPPGSWATQSRRGLGYSKLDAATLASQVQYVIDFQGPALDALSADAALKAVVTASGAGRVIEL